MKIIFEFEISPHESGGHRVAFHLSDKMPEGDREVFKQTVNEVGSTIASILGDSSIPHDKKEGAFMERFKDHDPVLMDAIHIYQDIQRYLLSNSPQGDGEAVSA